MLGEDDRFRDSLRVAQQALSAVAVAFGHSIAMREDTLKNRKTLEEDTALLAGSRDALAVAAAGMGFQYGERQFGAHEGGLGLSRMRDGQTPMGALVFPLSPDPGRVARACTAACALVRKSGGELLFLPPQENESLWTNAMSRASLYAALPQPAPLGLEDGVLHAMLGMGERRVILSDAKAAGLLDGLLGYAGGVDTLAYTAFVRDDAKIFAAHTARGQRKPGLFSILCAAAALLEDGLRLSGEGGCLRAALDNVLRSGWRARDMGLWEKTASDDEITALVREQVALAGELFEQFNRTGGNAP